MTKTVLEDIMPLYLVIVGENPVNVTKNSIVAVIPTWGPIYEFSFDMRINTMPVWPQVGVF